MSDVRMESDDDYGRRREGGNQRMKARRRVTSGCGRSFSISTITPILIPNGLFNSSVVTVLLLCLLLFLMCPLPPHNLRPQWIHILLLILLFLLLLLYLTNFSFIF